MREKILQAALAVFNKKGIQHSTLRDTAKEMSISDGHLRYYFKTKEDLLLALFTQMDEIIAAFAEDSSRLPTSGIQTIVDPLAKSFEVMYKYGFFFKESTAILEMYPKVYKAYLRLIENRKATLINAFEFYKENRVLAPQVDASLFPVVFEQFFILSDNWIKYADMKKDSDGEENAQINHYVALAVALFLPYLHKGLKEDTLKWIKEAYLI